MAIGGVEGYLAFEDPDGDNARDVRLWLHMGLGCGDFTTLVVGGAFRRKEFVLAGPPLNQIAKAEPLAEICETVASPEAWKLISYCSTGLPVKDGDGCMKLVSTTGVVPETKYDVLNHGFTQEMLDEIKCAFVCLSVCLFLSLFLIRFPSRKGYISVHRLRSGWKSCVG